MEQRVADISVVHEQRYCQYAHTRTNIRHSDCMSLILPDRLTISAGRQQYHCDDGTCAPLPSSAARSPNSPLPLTFAASMVQLIESDEDDDVHLSSPPARRHIINTYLVRVPSPPHTTLNSSLGPDIQVLHSMSTYSLHLPAHPPSLHADQCLDACWPAGCSSLRRRS